MDTSVKVEPLYVYLFHAKDTYYYRIGVSPDVKESLSKTGCTEDLSILYVWEYEDNNKATIVGLYIYKAFKQQATRNGWFFFTEGPEGVVKRLNDFISRINNHYC